MDAQELKEQKRKLLNRADGYDIVAKILKKVIYIVVKLDSGGYRTYGYDREARTITGLGTSNHILVETGLMNYFTKEDPKVKVISRNKQVNCSFKPVIADIIHSFTNFCYSWYNGSNFFKIFDYNPKLLCNLADLCTWGYIDDYDRYISICTTMYRCSQYCEQHPNESNLKKVFGLNPKNLRVFIRCQSDMGHSTFTELLKRGFTSEFIEQNILGFRRVSTSHWFKKGVIEYASHIDGSSWYYNDYLNMKERLPQELGKDFPYVPKTTSYKDMVKKHDEITEVYNRYRAQQKIAALKELNDEYTEKVLPKVKEFEYSNNTYSIIACPELKDLINEGMELHHCVGSYTDSVGHGKEYILFLRKNKELDKPFYTVNITTDNRIRQIHGFRNCNVTKEIAEFVEKWAKKFKLNASSYGGCLCHL